MKVTDNTHGVPAVASILPGCNWIKCVSKVLIKVIYCTRINRIQPSSLNKQKRPRDSSRIRNRWHTTSWGGTAPEKTSARVRMSTVRRGHCAAHTGRAYVGVAQTRKMAGASDSARYPLTLIGLSDWQAMQTRPFRTVSSARAVTYRVPGTGAGLVPREVHVLTIR